MKDLFIGSEPAFPLVNDSPNDQRNFVEYGMSKRFYAACAAMQGIISYSGCGMMIPPNAAKLSFEFADELLKQENEKNN